MGKGCLLSIPTPASELDQSASRFGATCDPLIISLAPPFLLLVITKRIQAWPIHLASSAHKTPSKDQQKPWGV